MKYLYFHRPKLTLTHKMRRKSFFYIFFSQVLGEELLGFDKLFLIPSGETDGINSGNPLLTCYTQTRDTTLLEYYYNVHFLTPMEIIVFMVL